MDGADHVGEPVAMRIVFIALGGAGLLFLLLAGGDILSTGVQTPTASVAQPAQAQQAERREAISPAPETSDRIQRVAPDARPVGSDVVAPPPVERLELQRIEPRPPLGELAQATPPKPEGPAMRLLHRPTAEAAGLVTVQGHKIAIDGIEVIAPDETCSAPDGSEWPCGRLARTAFRQWLRGRAVSCTVPEEAGSETVSTACKLGEQDVGEWLVRNGWARASDGGSYVELAEEAKAKKLGVFGSPPRQ
jgi:endonuclease YncB( thermonuclease family)